MIEDMDRFCRAAASFNARCVSLASVIVSRPTMDLCNVVSTH